MPTPTNGMPTGTPILTGRSGAIGATGVTLAPDAATAKMAYYGALAAASARLPHHGTSVVKRPIEDTGRRYWPR
jgi:hypothetical protein